MMMLYSDDPALFIVFPVKISFEGVTMIPIVVFLSNLDKTPSNSRTIFGPIVVLV